MEGIIFLDHPADIAAKVSGNTLEELFLNAVKAWQLTAGKIIKLKSQEEKTICLSASTAEELLIRLLNEINYFLYARNWFTDEPVVFKIVSGSPETDFKLQAVLRGGTPENCSEISTEIKAATFHQADISVSDGLYSTVILFDI